MNGKTAVEIRGATKSFGTHRVLDGIDLDIRAGQVAAVIGPSGAGKSTLLRTINHLDQLDLGYVKVLGELIGVREHRGRLHELGDRAIRQQRSRIGFVFQNFNLFPHLTILENVTEAPRAHRRPTPEKRALELLEKVGIAEKAHAYPRQLSGGQQQRAAIARALALEPELILFDEPTSALDPELVGEVLAVIKELARTGTTLVIVTHEIAFAREVADLVFFLDGGRLIEHGPAADVIDNPQHPRTREFIGKVL
ncbi:amino acid ABC transporter ATP-binding protein [Kineosporia mesophila]|uniref:Amino acid ABC transporter ATP-binding protein n=1 Tax=Kineosporia mesophila TaxID=566012 RepID=A0ABP6Z5T2_9ACTN|nr:amino acid ABC transporter ATP-binding protein [Kineosporia mesophila]MCD5351195.1 amino acid ABC transporter ATP-binding protein [Kineosporia mesophila]